MHFTRQEPIIVAGGGIGGLSAALALSLKGFRVTVLERGAGLAEAGAGIQLGPNATRLLRMWGLADALQNCAMFPGGISLFDGHNGRRLCEIPLGDYARQRYGAPYAVLHRADLHEMLLGAVQRQAAITVISHCDVQSVRDGAEGVAVLAGCGSFSGRALIGADGLRSIVRHAIAPDAALNGTGKIAWRALIPRTGLPALFSANGIGLWMRADAHLVHYPVAGGALLNVVAIMRRGVGHDQPFKPEFSGWPGPARDLLAMAGEWKFWPLFTLSGLRRWSCGRITLLGDAAHPILPFLASGSVLAMEDAAALAEEAAASPHDVTAAFARYEALRQPRARRVANASRAAGGIYHLDGPMRLARNLVLSALPPRMLLWRNDWLYRFCAAPGG